MKPLMLGPALLLGALTAAPARHRPRAATAPRAQDETWSWRGPIAPGRTLEVRDVIGSIIADAASGEEAVVTAVKRAGRHGDPRDVRIVAEPQDGGVVICVVYPGRSLEPGCRGRGGHHGDGDDDRNDTEVEFTVHVPRGAGFAGKIVNGDVEARGLAGPVRGESVNGSVDIETGAGEASAQSVNGTVRARVGNQGAAPLRFSSVNGAVDVTLPRDLSADLQAETVNGSITSDFEITVSGGLTMRRQRLVGRIGHGGRLLQLRTVNGSIRLHAAG